MGSLKSDVNKWMTTITILILNVQFIKPRNKISKFRDNPIKEGFSRRLN